MVECKCGCKQEITIVPGKVQKQFYSDACRKAYKRAELKESEAVAGSSVAEPRTDGTKQPRTLTPDRAVSDNPGQGINIKGITQIPKEQMCITDDWQAAADEPSKPKPELTVQGNIRVSKPGDADYVPQCETTKAFIEGRDKRPEVVKRGKDIKCFEDLPPYVQGVIHKLSTIDGKIDQTSKANRTAIAINYQHIFPDRFHSVGVAG